MQGSNKSSAEILEYILELEKNFPVKTWKAFGFHIWPIIRISLGLHLSAKNFFTKSNQISSYRSSLLSDSINSIWASVYSGWSDSVNNQKIDGKFGAVFLNVTSTRYFKLGGKWFNPFSDSFTGYFEEKKINSLVLEYTDTMEKKIPRYRNSKYIGTGINLMNLNTLFQLKFEKFNFSELSGFDDFLEKTKFTEKFFLKKILRVLNYSVYFEKILKKAKPGIAIVEGYYSYIAMGMLLAAHRLKIKTADIQHGVQSESDYLYSLWNEIPDEGYETLPNIFWCWTETEKENINLWGLNTNGKYLSLAGGNPVLELNENDEHVNYYTKEINELKNSKPNQINILYTHQAEFELNELLVRIIQQSPENWVWWIRFHPQYFEAQSKVTEQLSRLKLKNVIYDNIHSYPLSLLLKNMSLHVTEFSSSVLEADMLGVPSIVLSRTGEELFRKQIESGAAKYSSNESEFFSCAAAMLSMKTIVKENPNSENFKKGIDVLINMINGRN
ncbi:MAG: hypothetical protein JSS63_01885 [Bacteroidetes bacterium]|nr:hypothetical protein [Bacteroidota bacterium]